MPLLVKDEGVWRIVFQAWIKGRICARTFEAVC
jgi:hypothetical protein